MKKTLLVLSFALCATFAFAQTRVSVNGQELSKTAVKANAAEQMTGYKASIFSKADTLQTWEFAADNQGYSVGVIDAATNITLLNPATTSSTACCDAGDAHTHVSAYSRWARIPDTTRATAASLANTYPASMDDENYGYFARYMHYGSCANGFMVMSMQEYIPGWGGNGVQGIFNSYIALDPVSTVGYPLIDVRFFQYYRKFNADKCFLDISTNGTTWSTMEINIKSVDVAVNNQSYGYKTVTLPTSVANSPTVYMRIRWASSSLTGGAYGYIWMLDDVSVIGASADRWSRWADKYVVGAYGLMPEGLSIPLTWEADLVNNGVNAQNNVVAKVWHMDADQTPETAPFAFAPQGNISADLMTTKTMVIDGNALYDGDVAGDDWFGYSSFWMDENPVYVGNRGAIPTNVLGEQYVAATLTSDALSTEDTNTKGYTVYDTILYTVNAAENGDRVWGLDNGVLVRNRSFRFGYTDQNADGNWYVTDESPHYNQPGYGVNMRFTTGDNIPMDENGDPWVFRGIELVAGTDAEYCEAGARISATMTYDYYDSNQVYFPEVATGAPIHQVTMSEINSAAEVGDYKTFGDGYKTIRINFPEQPALEANVSYRLGYMLETQSKFTVAAANPAAYYTSSSTGEDSAVYLYNDEATAKYYNDFGIANGYDMYVEDGVKLDGVWAGFYSDYIPMIRAIIGPKQPLPRYTILVSCNVPDGDSSSVTYDREEVCGTPVSVAEGSRAVFTAMPSDRVNYKVTAIKVDGEDLDLINDVWDGETGNEDLRYVGYDPDSCWGYYEVAFSNVREDGHTLEVTFEAVPFVSIDPVAANVNIKLQPNPATSQVRLALEGVSGMVNCTLIDMSGRVVYSNNINAENPYTINLQNLAKGAYFVRITNNEFSTVEKLIVR